VADYGRQFNAYVRVIFACTQVEKFEARQLTRPPRADGKVRIGWVGTHGTLRAIEVVAPALRALCARHPEVELRLLCLSHQQAQGPDLRDIPHSVVPHYDEDTMIDEILDLDIGLFPPPFGLDDFAIRGPLKALLYMSGGRACVAQRGGDCAQLIEDGITGMLAESLQEWEDKLEILVTQADLRRAMGEAAQNFVRGRNSLAAVSASLEASLEFIHDHAEPNPSLTLPAAIR
jgi:glycosyltransferase involved in cell wall biosynthesis